MVGFDFFFPFALKNQSEMLNKIPSRINIKKMTSSIIVSFTKNQKRRKILDKLENGEKDFSYIIMRKHMISIQEK